MNKSLRLMQVFILLTMSFFSLNSISAQETTITLCHATGISTSPYEILTITYTDTHGHETHVGDIIPAPLEGCPTVEVTAEFTPELTPEATVEVTAEVTAEFTPEATSELTPEVTDDAGSIGGRVTICHATGSNSNPYEEITISVNGLNGHNAHTGDIIPAPTNGCPTALTPPSSLATAVPTDLCTNFLNDGMSFPNLDANNCAPDTTIVERPIWQAISLAPAVCLDWLLYHSNQTGDWELFRLDAVQSNMNLNLSRGLALADIAPSRSPDGQWITFMSNRAGNWEIYISAVDSDNIQRLSYNSTAIERDPVWSPTTGQIAYESNRNGNWDLYLFDTATGIESRISDSEANDVNTSWSQDGTKLLFQSDRDGIWQIYEQNLADATSRRLSDGNGNDIAPQYIYNGAGIVFRSFRAGSNSVLYWMNLEGGSLQAISDSNGYAVNQAVSAQGTLVAYTSNLDGDNDIYVYEFATGLSRQVTDNSVNDYAATWNCAGTSLTFTSDITGNPDLFSADALPLLAPAIELETQANQLTNLASQELYPMLSPAEENASRTEVLPAVMP